MRFLFARLFQERRPAVKRELPVLNIHKWTVGCWHDSILLCMICIAGPIRISRIPFKSSLPQQVWNLSQYPDICVLGQGESAFHSAVEHNESHVMWTHMTPTDLTDTYVFNRPVNIAPNTEMSEVWLIPHLQDREFIKMHSCSAMLHLHIPPSPCKTF